MKRSIYILTIILSCCLTVQGQRFQNVAEEYGLDFSYVATEYGGGISFVDYNQDGWDDLSFATERGSQLKIFENNHDGFDLDTTLPFDTSEVRQILWVDYNNDYLLDLFLALNGQNKLYRNEGQQQFTDVTEELGFDFSEKSSYCASWVDYNRDGLLDLFVTHRDSTRTGKIDVYQNEDHQLFKKMTSHAGLDGLGNSVLVMTTLDFNNDGWPDIFLGQDWQQGNQLLQNNKDGTFSEVSSTAGLDYEMNSMSATVVDINYDGYEDLYVTNTTEGNLLFVNEKDGSFIESAQDYNVFIRNIMFGAVFTDLDNDMDDDLMIGGQRVNFLFECESTGVFQNRRNEWGILGVDNDFNTGVAIGDYNNDGRIDVARNSITREGLYSSKNSLLKNVLESQHYIKLNLKGTLSNSFGIGTRIYVYADDAIQMKRIACGESFSSQHSYTQQFGLGNETSVDSIIIKWPSGVVTNHYDLLSNQIVEIEEPTSACMDSEACNYVPLALSDDGSCRYNQSGRNCVWDQQEVTTTDTYDIADDDLIAVFFDQQLSRLKINFIKGDYANSVNILDMSGRLVHRLASLKASNVNIELNGLASGIYLVHIRNPELQWVKKILKY